MEEQKYDPILVRYGGAKKSIFEMDNDELQKTAESIVRRAKEQAFSRGLPIYFSKGGVLMAEFPDGRIETVKKAHDALPLIAISTTSSDNMQRLDVS